MRQYNFMPRFADAVQLGEKRQTIRKRGKLPPPRVGDTLRLYSGLRTQACRRLRHAICTDVQQITISCLLRQVHTPRLIAAGVMAWHRMEDEEVEALAMADGFSGAEEFFVWFQAQHGDTLSGYLIKWD